MNVKFSELKRKTREILYTSGAIRSDCDKAADMLLDYDRFGNTFSGLTCVEDAVEQLKKSKDIEEEIVVDLPSMQLINGKGKYALILGYSACEKVVSMAMKNGIAIIGIYNSTYHQNMETYVRKITAMNCIGIVFANGGPSSTVPFGGNKPVTGTNPIGYGIPTAGDPIVFDAATSLYPFGAIGIAKRRGRKLPNESYYDVNGNITVDPKTACGIIPFGGYKGYAINILTEVLTGSLVRAMMGKKTSGESDLGAMFLAIDETKFQSDEIFKNEVSSLITDIHSVSTSEGEPCVVPGERGMKLWREIQKSDNIQIEDSILLDFENLYKKAVLTN